MFLPARETAGCLHRTAASRYLRWWVAVECAGDGGDAAGRDVPNSVPPTAGSRGWCGWVVVQCAVDGGGAAGDLQPFEDVFKVSAHGYFGDGQSAGDLTVGVAFGDQAQQF